MSRLSNPMTLDVVDLVWSAMGYDDFYTPRDLANSSGQPIHAVARVLEFLTRYGFAELVVKREPIFRKVPATPAPGDVQRILQLLIKDGGVSARQESDECVRFVEGPEISPEFLPTRPLSREKSSFNLGVGP